MTINLGDLDAHEQPSDELRAEWKSFSKKEPAELLNETKLDDPRLPLSETGFVSAGSISKNQLTEAFKQLGLSQEVQEDAQIIHHPLLPGLLILPNLVPENVQQKLLELMIHRDLSNPNHQTNMHLHFKALFPETQAQAAIVNFYTPGDTMMMHRDVSEESDRGLVSLSLGCDGIFMIAPSKGPQDEGEKEDASAAELPPGAYDTAQGKGYLTIPLRSGDAIYMTNESRYAWHGVPKVIKGTCPAHLENFPATEDGQYEEWRGWMKNKRVNLNVRQIK
ncbi:unnamed protein product [Clonostachys rosea f. rosea IK726]|uniref:Fe2OG dioxygenase domain-containing protein n=2 Tax=Bionectria ochroleuca TaxID=29856 RepID=A0A0B7JIA2_BIOOC|nr:unnamed protein product [Clonostachys rosea f. rosea IK726]